MSTNTNANTSQQDVLLYTTPLIIDILLTQVKSGMMQVKYLGDNISGDFYLLEDPWAETNLPALGSHIQLPKEVSAKLNKELRVDHCRLVFINKETGELVTILEVPIADIQEQLNTCIVMAEERTCSKYTFFNMGLNSAGRQQALAQMSLGGIKNALEYVRSSPPGTVVLPNGAIILGNIRLGEFTIVNKYNQYRRESVLNFHQEIAALLNTLPEAVMANNGGFTEDSYLVTRLVGLYFSSFRDQSGTISLSYPVMGYASNWHEHLIGKTITVSINGDRLDYSIQ